MAHLGPASVDPFGRPSFLYLTDTHRKRQAVVHEFARRAVFEPSVEVLGAFLDGLWSRWGDGRPCLSDRAVALLAIPVVQGSPYLAALGSPDETARSLAGLLDAGLQHSRPLVQPQVQAALDELRRATDGRTWVHRSLALRRLPALLNAPSPALAAWLARQPTLVIDDILQPTPLQTRCLLALADAWDAAGNDVTIAFACGDEPAAVLAGEEQGQAFAATRTLRRAVFEHLVANGRAEVFVAQPHGPEPLELALRSPPPEVPPVRVGRARSVDEEIGFVLDELQRVLSSGVPAEDCAIAVSDEARYAPALQRRAERRGLPVVPARGVSLRSTPLGRVLIHCLRARAGQLSPRAWLGLAADLRRPVKLLDRVLGPAGIQRGAPSTWGERLQAWSNQERPTWTVEHRQLQGLQDVLQLPPSQAWAADWQERWTAVGVLELAQGSELGQRVWAHFSGALHRLVQDLELAPFGDPDLELLRLLRTERVPLPGEGSVPVIGLQELRGLTPAHLWVLGLDRSWPAPPGVSALVDRNEAQRLAPVDRTAEARYLLAQIQRNAAEVVLLWPETLGTRGSFPSPLLEELGLTPVPVQAQGPQAEPAGIPQPAGRLQVAPDLPRRFGVTSAEVAVRCAARFWYGSVLRLRPEDPWDPELEPRRRGTAFHRMLQLFYERRELRPVVSWAFDAPVLHAIASEVLDTLEAEGGFEPVLQAWSRSRWLAGLVDDRPKGLLGAWLLHELERASAPEAVERPIRLEQRGIALTGVLDRVDRGSLGALVVDYKTGSPPSREAMELGLALQPLVYLESLGPGTHAAAFQRIHRPADVGYTGWFGEPDAIRAWGGRGGVTADPEVRHTLLDAALDKLEEVLAGDVSTTAHGPELAGCSHCPFSHVCRVVHR